MENDTRGGSREEVRKIRSYKAKYRKKMWVVKSQGAGAEDRWMGLSRERIGEKWGTRKKGKKEKRKE